MPESSRIVKSKSDSKDYRLIKLNNGLKVLLISDLNGHVVESGTRPIPTAGIGNYRTSATNIDDDPSDLNESDITESEGDYEDSEEMLSDEEDEGKGKPIPKYLQKKQAAAALCINVGSFSDPEDIPGLAHFLEHMVFMGSDKYPDENRFDAFIRLHGGSDNACTDCERTVFQFDIQPNYFPEALDIWARFFVSPLLKQDSVDREVKAVDSEFDMAMNDDDCRKEQLLGTIFPKDHPMAKFMWGNKKSLYDNPSEKGIDVYGALKAFHKAYYLAHFMTLCLQSPEKLDILEGWAREIFEDVPFRNDSVPSFSPNVPDITPFQVVKISPVRNVQELHLVWILPPQQKFYKTKPLHYVSWLVGHEGKGSILSLLRQKNMALALCGGNEETGFEQNEACSLFNITITLTDTGFAQYCEVLDIVFQYFSMLQKGGACERLFKEIQKIEDIDFMFQEEETAIENAVNQAGNVLLYPEEDILTGDRLLFDYSPDCINSSISLMSPNRCIIFLSSPAYKNLKNVAKEPWFGTSHVTDSLCIPEEWKLKWSAKSDVRTDNQLHLPSPNCFIAEKFDLKITDASDGQNHPKYPQLVSKPNAGHKLWFRQDRFFSLPKAYVRFHLVNPLSLQSPQDTVCLEILVQLLVYNLAEVTYDADAASLSYGAEVGDDGGLVLKFSGYNDKLSLLVDTVANYLIGFKTTEITFQQRLLQHARSYYNTLIKPGKLARSLRLSALQKFGWSTIDKYKACRDLAFDQFIKFVKNFLRSLYIESLIQGNYTVKEATAIAENFVSKMKCCELKRNQIINQRIIQLGGVQKVCKVKALNPTDDNSMVTVYFQAGQDNIKHGALMHLLESIMDEPCFDILRTKQQLGYSVFLQQHNTAGILGLTINVGTQNSKFSVEETSRRIIEFVTEEMVKIIQNMKRDDFDAQVQSLIAVLRNEDTHLGEEVDRNWNEVISRFYLFDRVQKEIDFLETCTHDDLLDFFTSLCLENDKVLHIQVRGNSHDTSEFSSLNEGQTDNANGKSCCGSDSSLPPPLSLEFLKPMCNGFQEASKFFPICGIEKLKNLSSFYPVSNLAP